MTRTFTERFSVLFIALSSLLISVNGLMLRSIDSANDWQVIFSRNLFFTPSMLLLLWIYYRNRLVDCFKASGWLGITAGVFLGLANTTVILAMSYTTIANALFTLSACPLITAILARMVLKERISLATLIAIVVAMLGIIIMIADGLSSGSLIGNLIALACATFFSFYVIALRRGKDQDMLPSSVVGGLVGMLLGLIGSNFNCVMSVHDTLICFVWGGIIVVAVYSLFVIGSRHVPGAEMMLITLIEFILGPIWVWLAFSEEPSERTLIGGAFVLAAVTGRSIIIMREDNKTRSKN